MKVAFDGTVLHGRKSGVGYYCEELLNAMLAIDHEDEFCVFSHKPLNLTFPSSNGNLKLANSTHFPIRAFYLHALLPRVLDSIQPDLCHYTNFLAPISEHRPYVVTIHDMGLEALRDAHPLAKRLYTRRLIPIVARKARLIITNSEFSKWEIVRYLGIPEDRIRVTPLAASPDFKPSPPAQSRDSYFLYVGNLEPRKNLERLIEAFARMPAKEHQLLIVGNRWYHGDAAEQKARSLGLNGRVKFTGYVSRAELPGLFSGATAFVYPSLLEGFGMPIVEAMACGAPVITSNNSSMKEVGGNAAVLVDPRNVRELTDALTRVAEDEALRKDLSKRGLARAADFSWEKTARLTLDAYREAVERGLKPGAMGSDPRWQRDSFSSRPSLSREGSDPIAPGFSPRFDDVADAIRRTVEYANLFQYPLTPEELRDRLFDLPVDEATFGEVLRSVHYQPNPEFLALRAERERISDDAVQQARPHLRTLASLPFVRMIAFSGSTAHRNMTNTEDVDLFMIVEHGKLWAVFLIAVLWAKAKGLRKLLCMNYLISDAALPLFEHDIFTAQQVASLKPIYGKAVYDRFIASNPFVKRCFPNFDPARHRNAYAEIATSKSKRLLEWMLRMGPVHVLERVSRYVLQRYLARKTNPASDVQLDPRRLKLHLHSHKQSVLDSTPLRAASSPLAPTANKRH